MRDIDQYREYARECLEAAKKADTPEEQKTFLEMAEAWTKAVYQLQRQAAEEQPHDSPAAS
jgi:hypothetical protein